MSTATKWLLAILVVFNLFMAALMSLLYGYRVSYKQELTKTENELQTVRNEKDQQITHLRARRDSLQTQVANLHDEISTKQEEIDDLQDEVESSRDEVADLTGRNTDLRSQVETLETDKDDLEQQLANRDATIEDKNERIAQLEERKDTISSQLAEVEADLRQKQVSISELQDRFVNAKSDLEATEKELTKYKKQYGSIGISSATPSVEGNIRAVNPNRNLVLINLGQNEGVKRSMRFSVIRGNQYVTELEVLESYDTWSAARSISHLQKKKPQVGDVVTTISPVPEGGEPETPPVGASENAGVSSEDSSAN